MPFYVGRTVALQQGRGGRSSLTLHEDGTVTVHAPDESDRPQERVGRWYGDPADESHVTVELEGRRYEYRIESTESGLRAAPR